MSMYNCPFLNVMKYCRMSNYSFGKVSLGVDYIKRARGACVDPAYNKRPRGLDALLELKTQYTRIF